MDFFYNNIKTIAIIVLLAVTMNIIRFFVTGYDSYLWLNWNLFLAIIPLFCAWLYVLFRNKNWLSSIFVFLWLVFLPNAPYLLTDFIHMADVGPKSSLWYDALMLFLYATIGVLSWVTSTRLVRNSLKWPIWSIGVIALVSGFGVYIGRYVRLNSWHIVTAPDSLLGTVGSIVRSPFTHEPVLMMTITFGIMLTVLYFALTPHDYEKTKN
ncbi:DUF1361 domain-containing protein [Patescibacteria group bacterium]|nr:DUF1361 domain-containing protein [Patescibacteria group bacterium]